MCGIVFKHNFDKKKPVNNDILQQYDKQHHRGKQGFGVFDGQYMHIIRHASEDNILKWLVKYDSNLILFHHRMPTSTVNVAKAAHPFSTKKFFGKTEYILVHNGVIRNANDLWVEHQQLGINYQSLLEDLSFNDSEALLWDFALVMEGKQAKMKAHGNMAFICMRKVNGKLVDMLYGRNTNPLMIKRTADSIELASEGAGVSILSDTLYDFNFRTHKTDKVDMTFPVYKGFNTSSGKGWHTTKEVGSYPNSGFRQQSLLPATSSVTEFDSYDDWHSNKYGVTGASAGAPPIPKDPESNWERLRAKYSKERLGSAATKSIGQILDAKKDNTGKYTVTEIKHEDAPIDIDELDLQDYSPTSSEIQNCAMEYMIEAEGNFEDAYALLELNYADYQDEMASREQTFSDIRQVLLMEAAMEFINSDDEYQNEKSVSSIWRALWSQKSLATA